MNIIKATVVLNFGMDYVILHTNDMPSPTPNSTIECLDVMFYAERDKGKSYVEQNFPNIPITLMPRSFL